MDNKRLLIFLPIVMIFFIGFQFVLKSVKQAHPDWDPPAKQTAENTALVTPTTAPVASTAGPVGPVGPSTQNSLPTMSAGTGSTGGGMRPVGAPNAVASTLGSEQPKDPVFPMQLLINSQGAGIDSVTLNDFWESAERKSLYAYQKPFAGQEAMTRPLATRWITINGQQLDVSKLDWQRVSVAADSATYVAHVEDNGKPLLAMSKTFTLRHRNATDNSQGLEVTVTQDYRNDSDRPINVHATINGPTTPARENQRSDDRMFVTGHDEGYQSIVNQHLAPTALYGKHSALTSSGDRWTDQKDLLALDSRPLMWLGAGSSYFEALLIPEYSGKPGKPAVAIASAFAAGLPSDKPEAEEQPTALAITTTDFSLAPGKSMPFNFNIYFGPKWRSVLADNAYYNTFPRCFQTTLVNIGGMCSFITFNWLINALYWVLWLFHSITRDWGLAIICLVICVRSLLHPITKRSQVQMLQMGKMSPEIERLKKKHGDNKDELNKAMMQVYKDQGMAPILGCLPMFLQTPIWIALWQALQSTFELRQAGFLRWEHAHLSWIADLSQPDNLISFHAPIPLLFFSIQQINILPLLLAVVFFVNQMLQPAPANMTPEQEQQRKMMKWVSLLFPVMLYTGPSGLNLYILTSTTIGIIESKIIRDHIKQRDEAEKSGRIIVDPGKKGKGKRRDDDNPRTTPEKKSGLAGWFADLQAKAEQIQRDAQRRGKDRA